jgi:hypothetical protein
MDAISGGNIGAESCWAVRARETTLAVGIADTLVLVTSMCCGSHAPRGHPKSNSDLGLKNSDGHDP